MRNEETFVPRRKMYFLLRWRIKLCSGICTTLWQNCEIIDERLRVCRDYFFHCCMARDYFAELARLRVLTNDECCVCEFCQVDAFTTAILAILLISAECCGFNLRYWNAILLSVIEDKIVFNIKSKNKKLLNMQSQARNWRDAIDFIWYKIIDQSYIWNNMNCQIDNCDILTILNCETIWIANFLIWFDEFFKNINCSIGM